MYAILCQMANKYVFILIKDQKDVNRKIEDKPYKLLRLILYLNHTVRML